MLCMFEYVAYALDEAERLTHMNTRAQSLVDRMGLFRV